MPNENNDNQNSTQFEDIISSSTPKSHSAVSNIADTAQEIISDYGEGIYKNLGNIIKFIAFLICFTIIGITFIAAYFIYSKLAVYTAIAIGIVVVGTSIGLITLFLIFGLGQLICQNNEILIRLRKLTRR